MLVQKAAEPLSLPMSEIQRLRTELRVRDKMQHIVQGTFQLSEQQEQEREHGGAGASESDHALFLHSDILLHMMFYVDAIELLMTIQLVSKPFYISVRNLLDWDTLSYDQAKLRSTLVFHDRLMITTIGDGCETNNNTSPVQLDSTTLKYEQYIILKKQATSYWEAACSRVGVLHGGFNPRETLMKVIKLRKTEQEKVLRCSRCHHWFSLDDIESRKRDLCDKYATSKELGHDFHDAIKKIDMKNRAQKFTAQLGSLEPPPPPRFEFMAPEPNEPASENKS